MKNLLVMMIVSLVLLPNLVFAKQVTPVSRYNCENQDPFTRSTYKGTLVVQQTGETSYSFVWDYGGENQYIGTGLFNFRNNAIGVVMTDIAKPDKPHKIIAIRTYRLNPAGNILKGPWTLQGSNRTGYETCRKTR